jgi:uncharacterized membrane protein
MERDRLVAFSDGVIAIIITVMVLELRAPHDADLNALKDTMPAFLSYVLSFIYVCASRGRWAAVPSENDDSSL